MKLSTIAVDPKAVEDGEWVKNLPEMDDLELMARSQDSSLWKTCARKAIRKLPRHVRNHPDGLPQWAEDRIANQCLVEVGIIDWRNLEYDGGAKPFSKDLLATLVADPVYQIFRTACLVATARAGIAQAEADEDLAKNSLNSSSGSSATEEPQQAG